MDSKQFLKLTKNAQEVKKEILKVVEASYSENLRKIKMMDKLIFDAPNNNISTYTCFTIFRDIASFGKSHECVKGKLLVTLPHYVQTHLGPPKIGKDGFFSEWENLDIGSSNNALYTIHMGSKCDCLCLLSNGYTNGGLNTPLHNIRLCIQRNSTFEIVSLEYVFQRHHNHSNKFSKCIVGVPPNVIKHYTLKHIKSPSKNELKKTYDDIMRQKPIDITLSELNVKMSIS
jgi:hypothetical protein